MEGIQTIQALKAVQSSLPAQTTIPSDELVMLYAADGTPIAKIARDDLVKAVASVMASNSQNTFSKLLGVQANGTPMGIGASDLASVLGGGRLFPISAPIVHRIITLICDSAKSVGAYTLFQGSTQEGSEYAWYGFRHNNTAIMILMSYNFDFGFCIARITDIANESIQFYVV